jgi:predicted DNA-binding transcriptional regulator YafY
MRELAWHLFTWGDKLSIVAPQALKDMMAQELAAAVRAHTSGTDVPAA